MLEPNLNSFSYKETLEEMVICNDLTMKDIYEMYKKHIKMELLFQSVSVTFSNSENIYFNFEVESVKGLRILIEPIEIRINDKKIIIICESQLNFIKNKYNIVGINCEKDHNSFVLNLLNLYEHKEHEYHFISGNSFYIFGSQEEIEKYLLSFKGNFIARKFQTPRDFEKNYQYYFDINNKYSNNFQFTVFEDNIYKRSNLVSKIINWEFGKYYYFFGASGRGKSITLIGALKYGIKSENVGTLYINCKTLRILHLKSLKNIIRQILIDEMVFLFRNNYLNYKYCCDIIKNFMFLDEYQFWELIEIILDYIKDIPGLYYLIAFDQYNNENDKNSVLNRIINNYGEKQNFRIIIFSSMNETDIRAKKIELLLYNDNNNVFYPISEVDEVLSNFNDELDEKEREIYFSLGKSIKVYNQICLIKNKLIPQTLDEYFEEKKSKIKFKIYRFYLDFQERKNYYYEKGIELDFTLCMGRILNFLPDKKYTKDNLKEIIRDVPFRFFDVQKENDTFIIKYTCPLIEQILIEIYKNIILRNTYSNIKRKVKAPAILGCVFEYTVIFFITEKLKKSGKKLFNFFNIEKSLKVKKFDIKTNEKIENVECKIQSLDTRYDYIIEQEVFCGKTLDFIIIHFVNLKPYVYGFQVSIHKENIYDINSLQKSYGIMQILLKKYFGMDFDADKMYFSYIFDYEEINKPRCTRMLRLCDENSLKYCFFDPENSKFVDRKGKEINDVNIIISKISALTIVMKNQTLDDFIVHNPKQQSSFGHFYVNKNQDKSITDIIHTHYDQNSKWEIIDESYFCDVISKYILNKNFFFINSSPAQVQVIFYNPFKIYDIAFNGEISDETVIDTKKKVFICEVKNTQFTLRKSDF